MSTEPQPTDAPEAAVPAEVLANAEAAPEASTEPSSEQAPAPAAAPKAPEMSLGACTRELRQRFPALFGDQPKPIKLRIQADIQARAPGVFSKKVLSIFLHRHTTQTAYLVALGKATQRFDLDGQPAGELAEEHRAAAREELDRRRAIVQERRAAEDDARRARFALVRDFERTTLTRANFCALKGIAEDQLDGLLENIRAEIVQWEAQRPARPEGDRPGGRPGGRPGARPEGGRRDGAGPRRDGRGGGRGPGRGEPRGEARGERRDGRGPRPPKPEGTGGAGGAQG